MSLEDRLNTLATEIGQDIKEIKNDIPDTTEAPIATTGDAANIAGGFVNVFKADVSAKSGDVAGTLGVVQSPPLSGTATGSTPTPVKLAACRDTLLSINGSFVDGFNWGDTYEYDGAQGDLIDSDGMCGAVVNSSGASEGVMPMNHLANSGKQFHNYFFRNSNPARFFVTCGPLSDTVRLVGPNPTINADGTSPDTPSDSATLDPNETIELNGAGNGEWYLYSEGANPFFVSRYADNQQYDQMVVFPPAKTLIGHCSNAYLSVIYPNTDYVLKTRLGNIYTGTVQPGVPLSIHSLTSGAESNTVSYDPNGCGVLYLSKPGSCISGADESGLEITSWQSVVTLGQQGALPLPIEEQSGSDKVRSSLSFFTQYTGNVKIWLPGDPIDTPTWESAMARHTSKTPVSSSDDQTYPAGVRYSAEAGAGRPSLPAGTRWRSDVPVYVVANYNDNGVLTDTDESVLSSVTPEEIKFESRISPVDYLRYRRVVGSGGSDTWVTA